MNNRSWFRYLAGGSTVAVLLYATPVPAAADGNAGVHLHKTVDPAKISITPNLALTLGVDKPAAIPGDTLTYTAVATNPTATFGMGGAINAEATSSTDAIVSYYWDELQSCSQGCGTGAADPHWSGVATFEAGLPGYTPVTPPDVHTGLALVAQSIARSGVTYPSSGDPILGTDISPAATAGWTYASAAVLTPAQIALLSDPVKAVAVRNVLHFEVTARNSAAAQPFTDPEAFANPFASTSNPGAVTNVTVTYTLPDGSLVAVGPGQLPALASIAPGASVTTTATFKVPAPATRGPGETEGAYVTRLRNVDGSALSATASAAGTGFSGPVSTTAPKVTTNEFVPIVTIGKGGPAQVDAGTTETNPLTLTNAGDATASSLSVTDTVPGGTAGKVSGVPSSLAAGAGGSPAATYAVPVSQAAGDLTDTAAVTWKDANGNPYGPLSSSFTTQVRNILYNARLTLAPASAGPNVPGTTQTLTATLLDRSGNPIPNQVVQFTITGANAGTGSATTDANGTAAFTYTGANQGSDVAQATVTAPGITLTSNTSTITWSKLLQPVVTTAVQGNFFANPNHSCTFDANPTMTPVFGQTFPDIMFNPDPSVVPHDISTVRNGTRPFTDLTLDVNGNYNGQLVAQGGGSQAGVGSLFNFWGEFTGNFAVTQPGDLTFRILHTDGYLLGVGGSATRVSGDLEGNPPATVPFNGYPVVGAWNTSASGSSNSGPVTVHFPSPGTYPYELDYTACGGGPPYLDLLTEQFVPQTNPLSIYVGYADGLRPGGSAFPFPWDGSPNTLFYGCPGCTYDGGAIRFDNNSSSPMTIDSITVDIGGNHWDLWPHGITLPAGQILIVTQTSNSENFDTSDVSGSPCNVNNGVIPNVNVTIGGVTTVYKDVNQVLNTTGFDQACLHSETHPWLSVNGVASTIKTPLPPALGLNLTPFNVPNAIQGQSLSLTIAAMDAGGNPVPSLPVAVQVAGVNAQTLSATTGADGLATVTYTGVSSGADDVEARAFVGGLEAVSNQASIAWTPPGGNTNNPLGPAITSPSPADGSIVTKPTPVDATIAPPRGHAITSWRVFYQAAAGGPQVVIGSGTGAPPSPLGVTFDPTLLADGAYALTVEATADNGATQDVSSGVSVIGALKLGRYATSFQDMAVPVDGYTMQVQRSYDSSDASSGDFGVGWRVSVANFRIASNHVLGAGGWTQYNSSCAFGLCFTAFKNSAPRLVTVVFPNGHTEVFDFTPTGGTNLFWACTPQFTARGALGTTSTLVPLDDTSCSYSGDGNLYGSNGAYNPQRFLLTTRSGMKLVLDHKLGLVSMTDRNGNALTIDTTGVHSSSGPSILFTRDSSGRITQITGPAGQIVSYTYSGSGDLASSTDPLGNVDTYTYDAAHHLLKVTGPQGALSSETYDTSGRLTSVSNANGQTTQIQDNPGAQTMTITDATGATTTVLTSDDMGDVLRSDVTSGSTTITTQFAYDSVGHVTKKTDGLGHVESATYDSAGDLVKYVDPLGKATTLSYDSFGNVTSVIAADGTVVETVTYDSNGNPVSMLGPGGSVVHFAFDSAGRTTSRTDAAGNVFSYAYDAAGHTTQVVDGTGKATTLTYDSGGRLATATDPLGNPISYTYDAAGNVVKTVDAIGATQTFTYNSLGLLTSATDPLGRTTLSTYDADGNVTSVKDRDGNTTSYTYDADGRLTRIDYPGGEFLAFSLDGFGRPATMSNSSSTITSTYDADGRLVNSTTSAAVFGSVSLSYTYDAAGNRLSSTGPDGTVNYSYDSVGRVVKVTDNHGGVFGVQYDSAGRIVGLTRPNGITDSYTYNVDGRLVGATSSRNGTAIQTFAQSLNANSQVVSLSGPSGTATYTHDADGRLVSVSGPGSVTQAYAYDAVGNRTSGPESTASTFNAADQRTSDTSFTYAYDNEGDRISKTDKVSGLTTHYLYNGVHQLIGIQYPDGTTTSYTYDALGRRLSVSAGGATTAYAYDGVNARLEYSSGALVASYVGSGQVDRPLEMTRAGTSYYYLQDLQGSVSNLTDSAGSVAAQYSYDAFGVPASSSTTVANPFTYTGREFDPKSGLDYNRARYYEPSTGSFISVDPIPAGPPYAYSGNDPVDFTDPSGAFLVEVAQRYEQVANNIDKFRAIGCTTALLGGFVEAGLDAISPHPQNLDGLKAIVGGVAVGCAFGLSKAPPTSATQLIIFPLLTAVAAGLIDFWLQVNCGGGLGGVDFTHIMGAVAGALLVSAGAAILGSFLPAEAAAASTLGLGLGAALLGGDLSSALDQVLRAGACH